MAGCLDIEAGDGSSGDAAPLPGAHSMSLLDPAAEAWSSVFMPLSLSPIDLCSNLGPPRAMAIAPIGAVATIDRTASVSN